jgi:uncharacterized membrane protein AbrB (regulator of aidB expression)
LDVLFIYLLEETLTNAVALFGAAALAAYVTGPFLVKVAAPRILRAAVYATFGVGAGMWSHSLSVHDRQWEPFELVGLPISMAILALPIICTFVYLRSRRKSAG